MWKRSVWPVFEHRAAVLTPPDGGTIAHSVTRPTHPAPCHDIRCCHSLTSVRRDPSVGARPQTGRSHPRALASCLGVTLFTVHAFAFTLISETEDAVGWTSGPHCAANKCANYATRPTKSGAPFASSEKVRQLSLAHAQTGEPTHPESV